MGQLSAKIPSTLRASLGEYLRRRNSDQPVSIANMIRRTRYALPDLALNDDELELLIAEEVIARKGNIAFDRHADYLRMPTNRKPRRP